MRGTPEGGPSLPCCCRWRSRGRGRGIGDGGNFLKEGTPLSPPSVPSRSEYFWLCYSLWLFHLHSAVKIQFLSGFPLGGIHGQGILPVIPVELQGKKHQPCSITQPYFSYVPNPHSGALGYEKIHPAGKRITSLGSRRWKCTGARRCGNQPELRDKPAPRAVAADLSRWPFYDNEQITVGPFPHGGTG